ncbi:unnamed protein product [Vitrella brassicaformis CCMP3155]|uniref:Apple domain-containing protein n=2 Tax=Vitrella brassicaformis TaxID=1169539 RepID=A0A0G4FDV3_VITBC|nr:unnamed protein product [Vitrella brassicaformis CCMP3155]|mmetsp:Transcript_5454/g.15161  ORF Transcript_5454/g.15161 Transcript_5454/m.15161 type:complete len:711 (+) Transcript_5454:141-2273(+)|eukprot:CEM11358.1 unnamed protein product [Vitrella brassicaformis CCMP3155]
MARQALLASLCLLICIACVSAVLPCPPYPRADTPDGVAACRFTGNLGKPRQLVLSPDTGNDLLVLDRISMNSARVIALWDDNGDGFSDPDTEQAMLLNVKVPLTHGLAVKHGFIFVSSDTTVFRYKYEPKQRTPIDLTTQQRVVVNMNADGRGGANRGHWTRSLILSEDGTLYVSIGSMGNVDRTSFRARIRRFPGMTDALIGGPRDFAKGEVFADGVRNTVGLAWGPDGMLWGGDTGADELKRADLGGDVHKNNPGDEINRFQWKNAGRFYGYPYCWSEYALPDNLARGARTQWVWPGFTNYTDEWCNNATNVIKPFTLMSAHTSPLGIAFYGVDYPDAPCRQDGRQDTTALPCAWRGDLFVALHGSWNREVPVGYEVVRVPVSQDMRLDGDQQKVLTHLGINRLWSTDLRPVSVAFDHRGHMYVSSDMTGEIVMVYWAGDKCYEAGIVFTGPDIKALAVDTSAACQAACRDDPQCQFFTFRPNRVDTSNPSCLLKATDVGRRSPADGQPAVSGPKRCYQVVAQQVNATAQAGGGPPRAQSTAVGNDTSASGEASACAAADELDVRRDCGYYGITAQQCLDRQCCYAPSANAGVPWCYYQDAAATFVAPGSNVSLPEHTVGQQPRFRGSQGGEVQPAATASSTLEEVEGAPLVYPPPEASFYGQDIDADTEAATDAPGGGGGEEEEEEDTDVLEIDEDDSSADDDGSGN